MHVWMNAMQSEPIVGNGLCAVPSAQRSETNGSERPVEWNMVCSHSAERTFYHSMYCAIIGAGVERHTGRSLRASHTVEKYFSMILDRAVYI